VHAQPGDDNINIAPRLGAISDKTTNVTIYGWRCATNVEGGPM
jgi:hypothetical protein